MFLITLVRRKQLIQKFSHVNLWQQDTAWFISCEMLYKYFSRFTASFDNHLNWLKNLSRPRNEDCFTQSSKMIVLVFFYVRLGSFDKWVPIPFPFCTWSFYCMRFVVTSGLTCAFGPVDHCAAVVWCRVIDTAALWLLQVMCVSSDTSETKCTRCTSTSLASHCTVALYAVKYITCISVFSGDVGNHNAWTFCLTRLQIPAFRCAIFYATT